MVFPNGAINSIDDALMLENDFCLKNDNFISESPKTMKLKYKNRAKEVRQWLGWGYYLSVL